MTKQEYVERRFDIRHRLNACSFGWRSGRTREKAYGDANDFIKETPYQDLKEARRDSLKGTDKAFTEYLDR